MRDHLGEMPRNTVGEALNDMLDAEADRLCNAEKYQCHEARLIRESVITRASFVRKPEK